MNYRQQMLRNSVFAANFKEKILTHTLKINILLHEAVENCVDKYEISSQLEKYLNENIVKVIGKDGTPIDNVKVYNIYTLNDETKDYLIAIEFCDACGFGIADYEFELTIKRYKNIKLLIAKNNA